MNGPQGDTMVPRTNGYSIPNSRRRQYGRFKSCRVLWPVHLLNVERGLIVGWIVRDTIVCVSVVVSFPTTLSEIQKCLCKCVASRELIDVPEPVVIGEWLGSLESRERSHCDTNVCSVVYNRSTNLPENGLEGPPHEDSTSTTSSENVTGSLRESDGKTSTEYPSCHITDTKKEEESHDLQTRKKDSLESLSYDFDIEQCKKNSAIWLTLYCLGNNHKPRIRSIEYWSCQQDVPTCPKCVGKSMNLEVDCCYEVIFYSKPDRHHFLSTKAMDLIALCNQANLSVAEAAASQNMDRCSVSPRKLCSLELERSRDNSLGNGSDTSVKSQMSDGTKTDFRRYSRGCSDTSGRRAETASDLDLTLRRINLAGFVEDRLLHNLQTGHSDSFSEALDKRQVSWPQQFRDTASTVALRCFVIGVITVSFASSIIFKHMNFFPLLRKFLVSEVFSSLSQTYLRLRVQCQWPALVSVMKVHRYSNKTLYLSNKLILYSSLALVGLDLIMGWLVCIILLAYPDYVLNGIHLAYRFLHIDVLKARVDWLMLYPAGLQLNRDLNVFIGSIIMTTINIWNDFTSVASLLEPMIVRFVGLVSIFGISVQLALTSDILNCCTLHVFYIYVVVARLLNITLRSITSLFYLFRGCKWNVLRNRVDSAEGDDVEQLLIGTILFTVLVFIFPTILVFYVCFLAIWTIIVGTQCILRFLLAFFNHFPLYLMFVHFLDPQKFSGGIAFHLLDDNTIGDGNQVAPMSVVSQEDGGHKETLTARSSSYCSVCMTPLERESNQLDLNRFQPTSARSKSTSRAKIRNPSLERTHPLPTSLEARHIDPVPDPQGFSAAVSHAGAILRVSGDARNCDNRGPHGSNSDGSATPTEDAGTPAAPVDVRDFSSNGATLTSAAGSFPPARSPTPFSRLRSSKMFRRLFGSSRGNADTGTILYKTSKHYLGSYYEYLTGGGLYDTASDSRLLLSARGMYRHQGAQGDASSRGCDRAIELAVSTQTARLSRDSFPIPASVLLRGTAPEEVVCPRAQVKSGFGSGCVAAANATPTRSSDSHCSRFMPNGNFGGNQNSVNRGGPDSTVFFSGPNYRNAIHRFDFASPSEFACTNNRGVAPVYPVKMDDEGHCFESRKAGAVVPGLRRPSVSPSLRVNSGVAFDEANPRGHSNVSGIKQMPLSSVVGNFHRVDRMFSKAPEKTLEQPSGRRRNSGASEVSTKKRGSSNTLARGDERNMDNSADKLGATEDLKLKQVQVKESRLNANCKYMFLDARPLPMMVKMKTFTMGLRAAFSDLKPMNLLKSIFLGRVIHLHKPRSSPLSCSVRWTEDAFSSIIGDSLKTEDATHKYDIKLTYPYVLSQFELLNVSSYISLLSIAFSHDGRWRSLIP